MRIDGKFRGLSADELAVIIDLACRMAPLQLMKQATKLNDVGKEPALVLAEHMIIAARAPEVVDP